MKKQIYALTAAVFVGGVFAQAGPPSAETKLPTDTKPQQSAEQRHEMRDAKNPGHQNTGIGGDAPLSPEISDEATGKNKAAMASEKKHAARDAKKPNHNVPKQGDTPK